MTIVDRVSKLGSQSEALILTNCRAVLPDQVVDRATVTVADGLIASITEGESSAPEAVDCEGDLLIPGAIDLHTDNLEKHFTPRPRVHWNGVAAALAHDAMIIGAGITTVFDALSFIGSRERKDRTLTMMPMIAGLTEAMDAGLLRADHLIHLRCETTAPELLTTVRPHLTNPLVRFLSVMDHTPGQRQYRDASKWREYYKISNNLPDHEIDALYEERKEMQRTVAPEHHFQVCEWGKELGVPIASHDDETPAHIDEAVRMGISISEFPVTIEAARAARDAGMTILMGSPNMVRGGSHSGNVSAAEMAEEGLIDVFASDYVPVSMLHAAFMLTEAPFNWPLPKAVATVTSNAAESGGLPDRGRLEVGKRADLVRLHLHGSLPSPRMVWREGVRVS